MDLMCVSQSSIYALYVSYFIAFGLGGFLSFPIMDKISRRQAFFIFGTLHILAQVMIIFLPFYWARFVGFTLMGLMCAKNSLCFTWLFELVDMRKKSIVSSAVNSLDFAIVIIAGIYYKFASREWAPLILAFFWTCVCCFVLTGVLCPESPKWLLLQGRNREAIESLNYIAKFNGCK